MKSALNAAGPGTLIVRGGTPLSGRVRVQGAKNASLPIMIGTLLTAEPVTLHGVPRIADVDVLLAILSQLGTRYAWIGRNTLTLHTPELSTITPPPALVLRMRASFELWGAILARAGESKISVPGGCIIGPRPVDQHVKAFRQLGFDVLEWPGYFYALRNRSPEGRAVFELKTVGGTRNAIMAATLGSQRVVLENASLEPEVVDLIDFLNHLGARIRVVESGTLEIEGVSNLRGGEYRVIPDRMEAGTYLMAAAATRGKLLLEGVAVGHLQAVIAKLEGLGVHLEAPTRDRLIVDARRRALRPTEVIAVAYPGFPTDLHPQIAALLATIPGKSRVTDHVFPERWAYAGELERLGAHITRNGNTAVISGTALRGGTAKAVDIRAGGALVIAALAAEGESTLGEATYLQRGYEDLVGVLASLGAEIRYGDVSLATTNR